ncbi:MULTISPECIES: hypothetical protein [Sphingomonas]|jgi:hypothetical protein|uniref:Lysis protein n=1 Tax=Sphingomonas zeae TaxID=1646122 RepID=A0A7Y6B231_9SPHN|nr:MULTISPECIES: hypothetical protein [Sphingomonas]MBB4049637.1 hypothetical protein [Sphingomonas zeae]MDK8187990.1 hypothetical protein [Sphingomonas zeae]MDK8217942.1 hypothetical protein [Sphingomonas sp. UMB7805-LC452B]NUU46019.1 hypothetical protein [Sphingomonas zeae]
MKVVALLVRFWPALVVLAMGIWVARLDHLRADYRQTLTNERAAQTEAIAAGERARLADQVRFAQQQAAATQTYAATLAARQPLIIHSKDTVTRYAQTDAGRALCRAPDRVRDIDALDALLARDPAAPGSSGGAVPADGTAPPAGR